MPCLSRSLIEPPNPCYNNGNDCPKRATEECRPNCKEWDEWLENHLRLKREIKKQKIVDNAIYGMMQDKKTRNLKKWKRAK